MEHKNNYSLSKRKTYKYCYDWKSRDQRSTLRNVPNVPNETYELNVPNAPYVPYEPYEPNVPYVLNRPYVLVLT